MQDRNEMKCEICQGDYRRDTGEDAIISASLFVDERQNRQIVFTFVECSRMEADVQSL